LHPEIRLGFQEALVNAAKHGNKLDPSKRVVVQFSSHKGEYSWVICDQGNGFISACDCSLDKEELPHEEAENGRGFCILHQIFDQVHWNRKGNQLRLCRKVTKLNKKSLI
jgi:anti-sigma regulatory factor (Ser/Thr protein kinase)